MILVVSFRLIEKKVYLPPTSHYSIRIDKEDMGGLSEQGIAKDIFKPYSMLTKKNKGWIEMTDYVRQGLRYLLFVVDLTTIVVKETLYVYIHQLVTRSTLAEQTESIRCRFQQQQQQQQQQQ
ncbi:hypothetical protein M0802_005532 [Mischocyttarus mexicanus]|nr:hypothetical protein M0802_005532 [Mischocyttarus mexicanus]